jgi:hypothetical protein
MQAKHVGRDIGHDVQGIHAFQSWRVYPCSAMLAVWHCSVSSGGSVCVFYSLPLARARGSLACVPSCALSCEQWGSVCVFYSLPLARARGSLACVPSCGTAL